jgi:hypothetical protein
MTPSTTVSTSVLGLLQIETSLILIGRHRVEQQIDVEPRLFRPVDAASAAEGLNEFALALEGSHSPTAPSARSTGRSGAIPFWNRGWGVITGYISSPRA